MHGGRMGINTGAIKSSKECKVEEGPGIRFLQLLLPKLQRKISMQNGHGPRCLEQRHSVQCNLQVLAMMHQTIPGRVFSIGTATECMAKFIRHINGNHGKGFCERNFNLFYTSFSFAIDISWEIRTSPSLESSRRI